MYWIIGLIIWVIVIAVIVIYYRGVFVDPDDYGIYDPPIATSCIGACGQEGTQELIEYCRPNPQTRRGCLVDGQQTFLPKITTKKCTTQCSSSNWHVIQERQCLPYNNFNQVYPFSNQPQLCSDDLSTIARLVMRECVYGNNPNGPNFCVDQAGIERSPGYSEQLYFPCEETSVNQCGTFNPCFSNLTLVYSSNTLTTTSEPFNLFYEGTLIEQGTCVYLAPGGIITTITPQPNDPQVGYCPNIDLGCRQVPTPTQVINKTILTPTVQLICATSTSQNSRCIQLGRKFPCSPESLATLNSTLRSFVQHPFTLEKSGKFLGITPDPNQISAPILPNQECSLNFWWVPNSNSSGPFSGKLFVYINQGTIGWVSSSSSGFQAKQAMVSYLGPDLSTPTSLGTVVSAGTMTLTILSVNPAPPSPAELSWTVNIVGSNPDPNFMNVKMTIYPLTTNLNSSWLQNSCLI